jgi:hypothetical protein
MSGGEMNPRIYHRDSRGRFCRRKPAPTLIDPTLVAQLGKDRRPFELTTDQQFSIVVLDEARWREALSGKRSAHEQEQGTEASGRTP